jgi:NAD+ synthase (glutamine-hydrolysing)
MRRFESTSGEGMVIGVRAGLDSTHALIRRAKVADRLGLPRSIIRGYTMPGLRHLGGTKSNAWKLMNALGITAEEIDIRPAAEAMLEGDRPPVRPRRAGLRPDLRERAGGPQDRSPVPPGRAARRLRARHRRPERSGARLVTYGSATRWRTTTSTRACPKTLIQYLIRWVTRTEPVRQGTDAVLEAILAQEISPELVPSARTAKCQSTEQKIGPYNLNDFYLHHIVASGSCHRRSRSSPGTPGATRRTGLARRVPRRQQGRIRLPTIKKWLESFLQRFFGFAQFKRSAIPNGPKVSTAGALSPRGDWRAPSDAVADVWLDELRAKVPD